LYPKKAKSAERKRISEENLSVNRGCSTGVAIMGSCVTIMLFDSQQIPLGWK
jgi:hypothetical protein